MWGFEGPLTRLTADRAMATDLVERDGEFVATVDLPGFEREDADIRVTDRTLRIDTEREEQLDRTEHESFATNRHSGRYGSLKRSTVTSGR